MEGIPEPQPMPRSKAGAGEPPSAQVVLAALAAWRLAREEAVVWRVERRAPWMRRSWVVREETARARLWGEQVALPPAAAVGVYTLTVANDHTFFVGEILSIEEGTAATSLSYVHRRYHAL